MVTVGVFYCSLFIIISCITKSASVSSAWQRALHRKLPVVKDGGFLHLSKGLLLEFYKNKDVFIEKRV